MQIDKADIVATIQSILKKERKQSAQIHHIDALLENAFSKIIAEHEDECKKIRGIIEGNSDRVIGNTGEMQEVAKQIRQIAPTEAIVLVRGKPGTGKEYVARNIHHVSERSDKPFIILNCDSLSEDQSANSFESTLFGYERSAFTGANSRHIGKAEQANGGTLFLDEVADLSPSAQTQMLQFLQDHTFSRVGSNIILHADIRVIASTSKNLESMIQEGTFRKDLYYRLNVFQINLPELSQRKTDILLLADHFIEKMNLKYGKKILRLTSPAIDMLMSYHWPGNVRELENCIEHACLATTDVAINAYDLPPSLQTDVTSGTALIPEGTASLETLLESYEREILTEALRRHNGNMSAAGRDLSVSPRMMHYKIKKMGLET